MTLLRTILNPNRFTMRRLLVMFAIPLLAAVSACSDVTKDEIADVLIISQDNVAFPKEGGTATISVACPSEWHSTVSDQSWITAADNSDNVTITVKANETGDVRRASVLLVSASGETKITVSQSWSGSVLSLEINAPENIELDSEGDSFAFTVETTDEWSVKSDVEWITAETNGKLVSIIASANGGEHRDATITVTASANGKEVSKEIKVSQISKAENVYFRMLGRFGLYAERWYLGGNAIDEPGIGSYCTIEQKEYGKTFAIKDLFVTGTEYEAAYDKENKQMVLTLGSLCMTVERTLEQKYYYYYLVQQNIPEKKFESGILYGTIGTGTDGTKDDCEAILLSGFDEAYGSLGLTVRIMPDNINAMLSDVFYADGKMYFVRADESVQE